MTEISTIHDINYILLNEFDRVCRENGISYYLDGGTMIASVREKDFIEWDDDVDVHLMRDEYEKLRALPKSVWGEDFLFLSYEDFNGYFFDLQNHLLYLPFKHEKEIYKKAKGAIPDDYIHCISLDVFVLENSYKGIIMHSLTRARIYLIHFLLMGHRSYIDFSEYKIGKRFIIRFLSLIGKRINIEKLFNKYKSICEGLKESEYVSYYFPTKSDYIRKLEKKWWDAESQGTIRGKEFPIPRGYDYYLKLLYGDYMSPPPPSQREPYHYAKSVLASVSLLPSHRKS